MSKQTTPKEVQTVHSIRFPKKLSDRIQRHANKNHDGNFSEAVKKFAMEGLAKTKQERE